jgi:hypothetical protein
MVENLKKCGKPKLMEWLFNTIGPNGIAVVFATLLGQGPAYMLDVDWALAQQLSKPREFQESHTMSHIYRIKMQTRSNYL